MTTAQIINLLQTHEAQIDKVKLLQVLQKQIKKAKKIYTASEVVTQLKNKGLVVSRCQGRWAACAVNHAAIELGLVTKRVMNGFEKGYTITDKGLRYGLKSPNGLTVKYSPEAIETIENFFVTQKHDLHKFVVQ